MSALTLGLVTARAKCSDLNAIKQINLFGCNISDITICEQMTSVEVMAFTKNDIKTLEPLKYCKNLRELYLRQNDIQDLDELDHLKGLQNLELLCLTENPCCEKAGNKYRRMVLNKLPKLKKLDNVVVHPDELKAANVVAFHPSDKEEEVPEQCNYQPNEPKLSCTATADNTNYSETSPTNDNNENSTTNIRKTNSQNEFSIKEYVNFEKIMQKLSNYLPDTSNDMDLKEELSPRSCLSSFNLSETDKSTNILYTAPKAQFSDTDDFIQAYSERDDFLSSYIKDKELDNPYNACNDPDKIDSNYERSKTRILHALLLMVDSFCYNDLISIYECLDYLENSNEPNDSETEKFQFDDEISFS